MGWREGSIGIILGMKMDRLEGLASFKATSRWKWLPGYCFGNENGQFESFGGLLGDLGLERVPMPSFWQ